MLVFFWGGGGQFWGNNYGDIMRYNRPTPENANFGTFIISVFYRFTVVNKCNKS